MALRFSTWVVTAVAVVALLGTARELSAGSGPCEIDIPNGILGDCVGQTECEQACEMYHPGSMVFCGECCWCLY